MIESAPEPVYEPESATAAGHGANLGERVTRLEEVVAELQAKIDARTA